MEIVPPPEDNQLYVLMSVAKSGTLQLQWVEVTSNELAQAQVCAGTNTLALTAEIAQNIKSLLTITTQLGCFMKQREHKPVAKLQLKCTTAKKKDTLYPLNSIFLSTGYCQMQNLESCVEYIFEEGDSDCQHEFVQFYFRLNSVFYNDRSRRSLFSFYSLNEDAVADDILLLRDNIMTVDTNMRHMQENIIQYLNRISSAETNYTLLFRRSGRYMIKSELHDAIMIMSQSVMSNHMAVLEYQRIVQVMLAHLSGTMTELATLSQGNSVCRVWEGRTKCIRDIPSAVCTPFDYQITMRVENVVTQKVKKIHCVPCFAPSYDKTGLSSCNNHFIFSTTNDMQILLLSNGLLIESGIKTDRYDASLNELLLLHSCYFNIASPARILVSCKKQTSMSNKDNQVYKLHPYQLVSLSSDDFPIHISSYLITFDQIDQSIQRKQIEMVTKSVELPVMYSVDSLPYLLEDLEFEEQAKPITFLSIIDQYEQVKTPFIIGVVVAGLIILVALGYVLYRCGPCFKYCYNISVDMCNICTDRITAGDTDSDAGYGETRPGRPMGTADEAEPMVPVVNFDKTTQVRPTTGGPSSSVRARAPPPPLYSA